MPQLCAKVMVKVMKSAYGQKAALLCLLKYMSMKKHMNVEMENGVTADFGSQSFGIGFGNSVKSVKGTGRSL